MRCRYEDGRTVATSLRGLSGSLDVVRAANEWLIRQSVRRSGLIAVTPTGPFVAPSDELAQFAAVNAAAPGGEWDDPPNLDDPEGAIF